MTKRQRLGLAVLAVSTSVMVMGSGCTSKQVDLAVTGATLVPGTTNLYRFCDGSTLVYFSNWGSSTNDEYEFIVYEGCSPKPPAQHGVQNLPDEGN